MKTKIPEYECFNDLAAARQRGRDYDIETRERSLDIIFIAPHGGKIEPETEHIARHLAGDDFSFHVFESYLPTGANNLHITSHHYDEPSALALVQRCRIGVGIHGRRSPNSNDVEIWLGGLNREKVLEVSKRLKAVGFETRTEGHDFQAKHPRNICNRAAEHGIQLEITRTLRQRLRREAAVMDQFSNAIRTGLGV